MSLRDRGPLAGVASSPSRLTVPSKLRRQTRLMDVAPKRSGQVHDVIQHQEHHQQQVSTQCHQRNLYAGGHRHRPERGSVDLLFRHIVQRMDHHEVIVGNFGDHGRSQETHYTHVRTAPFLLSCYSSYPAGKRLGATTCAARISESPNSSTMMVQFTQLFQVRLTYWSPNTCLSLSRS